MSKKPLFKDLTDCFLYALTPPAVTDGSDFLDMIAQSLEASSGIEGGIDILQLRLKKESDRSIIGLGRPIRQLTKEKGVLFIVNDRADLCQILEADGLHLGQDDIPIEEARKIVGENKIIGVSTHTLSQALMAEEEGANYIGYGPCYQTKTKKNLSPGINLNEIKELNQRLTIPFFAIGGLGLENIGQVLAAGAKRVAICAGIYQTGQIRESVRLIREHILKK